MCPALLRNRLIAGGTELQRLFSAFPSGWPGLGLLLLRILTGVSAARYAWLYGTDPSHTAWMLSGLLALIAVSQLLGLFTPVGCALLFFVMLTIDWSAFLVAGIASALFLLGPGAFSIDARLFGRREIIIPPASRKHDQD